jgi:hypothetical protein
MRRLIRMMALESDRAARGGRPDDDVPDRK